MQKKIRKAGARRRWPDEKGEASQKAGDEVMRKNWRLEPILEFELETKGFGIRRKEKNGMPGRPVLYKEEVSFAETYMEQYWEDAVYWYKKAALQNEPLAVKMLQSITDFKSVERQALSGNANAQYYLSAYYFYGYGIYEDPQQGAKWLHHAAKSGSRAAIRSIEEWNKDAEFVQVIGDPDFFVAPYFIPESCKEFRMKARHGKIQKKYFSQTQIGTLWEEISKLDFYETEFDAMIGNPKKQYQLAWMYDWGIGVKQDMKEAIKWFVESAFNQCAPAQTELGIMYHYGIMATTYRLEVFDGKEKVGEGT